MKKEEPESVYLDFFIGRTPVPIARNKEGKICLLNITECKKRKIYVNAGETWRCEIEKEEEKKCFIIPIVKIFSKEENDYFIKEKTKLLKLKYNG